MFGPHEDTPPSIRNVSIREKGCASFKSYLPPVLLMYSDVEVSHLTPLTATAPHPDLSVYVTRSNVWPVYPELKFHQRVNTLQKFLAARARWHTADDGDEEIG